eukprot:1156818-Pelagomonas_calceolata.AAC.9
MMKWISCLRRETAGGRGQRANPAGRDRPSQGFCSLQSKAFHHASTCCWGSIIYNDRVVAKTANAWFACLCQHWIGTSSSHEQAFSYPIVFYPILSTGSFKDVRAWLACLTRCAFFC